MHSEFLKDPRLWAGAAFSAGLIALAVRIVLKRRLTPAEKERRRRVLVQARGRTVEGTITEADAAMVHYSYELRGVAYSASQDITALVERIPGDPSRLVGPVSVKYVINNPANSIVLSEDWSGLPAIAGLSESETTKEEPACKSPSI
jgi:hypothetical protein